MKIPGYKLKQIRLALELSQVKFADLMHIEQNTLSMIETNRNGISSEHAETLYCDFYVSPHWLLRDAGKMFAYPNMLTTGTQLMQLRIKEQIENALSYYNQICYATPALLCDMAGISLTSLTASLNSKVFIVTDDLIKLWSAIGYPIEDSEVLEIVIYHPKN